MIDWIERRYPKIALLASFFFHTTHYFVSSSIYNCRMNKGTFSKKFPKIQGHQLIEKD